MVECLIEGVKFGGRLLADCPSPAKSPTGVRLLLPWQWGPFMHLVMSALAFAFVFAAVANLL